MIKKEQLVTGKCYNVTWWCEDDRSTNDYIMTWGGRHFKDSFGCTFHYCEVCVVGEAPVEKSKKILVLGHGQHGKDCVADIMTRMLGLTSISSSVAALDTIYVVLSMATGIVDKDELFNTRGENRGLWKEAITLLNTPYKDTLCKMILEQSDIYVGMRCDLELEKCYPLFDDIYYVDASKRKPLEASMLIKYDPDRMTLIDNNGPEYMLGYEVAKALGVLSA